MCGGMILTLFLSMLDELTKTVRDVFGPVIEEAQLLSLWSSVTEVDLCPSEPLFCHDLPCSRILCVPLFLEAQLTDISHHGECLRGTLSSRCQHSVSWKAVTRTPYRVTAPEPGNTKFEQTSV